MGWYSDMLTDTATYWAVLDDNDGYGNRTFVAPVQVPVRWTDKTKLMVNKEGEEFWSQAMIHLDQDVVLDGYLYLGTSAALDPQVVVGASRIELFKKTHDVEGNEYVRRAWL